MILVFFFMLIIILLFVKITAYITTYSESGNLISFTVKYAFIKVHSFKLLIQTHSSNFDFGIYYLKKNKKRKEILYLRNIFKEKRKEERIVQFGIKALKLEKFDVDVEFGADNAYYTAVLGGYISLVYGIVYSSFKKRNKDLKREFCLIPNYNSQVFKIRLNCIISTNLANIIKESFRIKKRKKGG